jgi:hypothetical protein
MHSGKIFQGRLWLKKGCFADNDGDAGVDIIVILCENVTPLLFS